MRVLSKVVGEATPEVPRPLGLLPLPHLRCVCLDDNPRETARGRESSPSSTTVVTRGRP